MVTHIIRISINHDLYHPIEKRSKSSHNVLFNLRDGSAIFLEKYIISKLTIYLFIIRLENEYILNIKFHLTKPSIK